MFLRPTAAFLAVVCLLGLAIVCPSCDDAAVVTPGPPDLPSITSPGGLIAALVRAVDDNDCDRVSTLFANEPDANASFRYMTCTPTDLGETSWGYAEEVLIFCRLLEPMIPLPGVPPVSPELWLQAITLALTPLETFTERPDLYSTDGGADGKLDPQRWRALDARHTTYFFFDLAGTDYKVEGEANFVVIEDLTKHLGEPGHFLLYIWEDLCEVSVTAGQQTGRADDLGRIKAMYRARHRPETVIEALASAYARRDPDLLQSVLAHDPGTNAHYVFLLAAPTDVGATQWEYDEEVRIHRRMFRPELVAPGEPAVPQELWLRSVQIEFWMTQTFQERPDLYSTEDGDGKLDARRWRAMGGRYGTYVLLDVVGIGYKVESGAQFVVIEDRAKEKGEAGKFLLYAWDDRQVIDPDASIIGIIETTWSNVKALYR